MRAFHANDEAFIIHTSYPVNPEPWNPQFVENCSTCPLRNDEHNEADDGFDTRSAEEDIGDESDIFDRRAKLGRWLEIFVARGGPWPIKPCNMIPMAFNPMIVPPHSESYENCAV